MAKTDNKLQAIMHGQITNSAEIARILSGATDAEFLDVLNYLDGNIIKDLQDKLPESKRNLLGEFALTRRLSENIMPSNDMFTVDAKEYVKNSENLDKWKIDIKSKEFDTSREVVNWMNVSDEAKQLLIDTAVMKAKEESRNVKNLTEQQYKDAINFEIQQAVYQVAVVSAAAKENVNPKIATQEAGLKFIEAVKQHNSTKEKVQEFVETNRKKLTKTNKTQESQANILDVSVDSILAYSAKTSEWIEHRKNVARNMFADTKVGAKVLEITDNIEQRVKEWDNNLSQHKKWGKTYTKIRPAASVVAKFGRCALIGMTAIKVAQALPASLLVYGTYAVATNSKNLVASYKKAKQTNQNLYFAAHVANNKIDAAKSLMGTVTAMVCFAIGMHGAEQVAQEAAKEATKQTLIDNALTWVAQRKTRITLTAGTGVLNVIGHFHRSKKIAAKRIAAGETNVKQASVLKSTLIGMGTAFGGFALGSIAQRVFGGWTLVKDNIETPNNDLLMPQDQANLYAAAQGGSSEVQVTVEQPTPTKIDPSIATLLEGSNCDDNPTKTVVSTSPNDCARKIAAQVIADETKADIEFWSRRAKTFVDGCDQEAILLLIKTGDIDLSKFPGINSVEEFTYKYGLMARMNLPHQQPLLHTEDGKGMLDEIARVNEIRNDTTLSAEEKLAKISKAVSFNKLAPEIANAMNSYGDRGDYLCEDLREQTPPVNQQVEEKQVVEQPSEEKQVVEQPSEEKQVVEQPSEEKQVVTAKVKVLEPFEDKAAHTAGKDWTHKSDENLGGTIMENTINYKTGEKIAYSFQGGHLKITTAELQVNEDVQKLATYLKDVPNVEDPETTALQLFTKSEVLRDMYRNGVPEEVKGADIWKKHFSDTVEKYGITIQGSTEKVEFYYEDETTKAQRIETIKTENQQAANKQSAWNKGTKDYGRNV